MSALDAQIRIELFGGLRLVRADRVIDRFRTHNAAALLAYLALNLNRRCSRDELLDLLWPDSDVDAARGLLRTTLSYLRRPLEPPGVPFNTVLVADRSCAQLNPAIVSTDFAEFVAAREAAANPSAPDGELTHLASAVRLYSGELISGYYDEWIAPHRERAAEAYLASLKRIVRLFTEKRDYSSAIDHLHRMLAVDALDERVYRDLLALYSATGQTARGLKYFDQFVLRMRDELNASPSPEICSLAEKLREAAPRPVATTHSPAVPPPAPVTPTAFSVGPNAAEAPAVCRVPLIPTAFFGREDELVKLQKLTAGGSQASTDRRLITVTGPGGVGKTRFAVEACRTLVPAFEGGAWFVPLEDVREPHSIPDEIARALRIRAVEGISAYDQLIDALSGKRTLLAIDNFEQLVVGGASVVSSLLRALPQLSVLVTSRRSLELPEERELPLKPLSVPAADLSPEEMMRYPGVQLFADRVQHVRPEFQLSQRNAADVAALTARLEGIPLALELAAARSRTLTPAQILEYLAGGLEHLVNRRAEKDGRHRSLWAAIQWSYQLLTPQLRQAFARLSVFQGGWSLDAAAAVLPEMDAADILDQLSADSLIVAEEHEGIMRYRMLNTIREFARDRLQGAEADAAAKLYMEFYASLADRARLGLAGSAQARWLRNLDDELENIRAAWEYPSRHSDAAPGLRIARGLWRYWVARGRAREGLERSLTTVDHPDASKTPELYVDALNCAGGLALAADDYALSRELHDRAADAARKTDNVHGLAVALDDSGAAEIRRGNYKQALELLNESLTLHRGEGDEVGTATVLAHLGVACQKMDDIEGAEKAYGEAVMLFRRIEDPLQLATSLSNLGIVMERKGDFPGARALYDEALGVHERLGNRSGAALTIGNLGVLARRQGDPAAARNHFERCIEEFRDLGQRRGLGIALAELGSLMEEEGDQDAALRLTTESLEIQRSLGTKDGTIAALTSLGRIQIDRGDLTTAAANLREAAQLCAGSLPPGATAETLLQLARLAASAGDHPHAAALLGAVEELRSSSHLPEAGSFERDLKSSLLLALGSENFTAALNAGRSLTVDAAIRLALHHPE